MDPRSSQFFDANTHIAPRRTRLGAFVCTALLTTLVAPAAIGATEERTPAVLAHHRLEARIAPGTGSIEVTDHIQLHPNYVKAEETTIELRLHAALAPTIEGATLKILRGVDDKAFHPKDISRVNVPVNRLRITLPPGSDQFVLRYKGTIAQPPTEVEDDYQRSFAQTTGLISTDGVYLGRSSFWVPDFADALVSFELRVYELPRGWSAVSEGGMFASGVDATGLPFVEWGTTAPVDDIHLVAGPFTIRERTFGDVVVRTFLRSDDRVLSEKYLEVTGQYLRMYEDLLGTFPWPSFALVENFWETGYGMPGFTLLGPQVIRFPFILHSSYPHELLHNWWGNGVYLDVVENNWAEGLTAYLADHLVAEQRRTGAEYRRATLSKFQSFVTDANDFPLRKFSGRNSAASEAIGYGKWMMVLHQLRLRLGDDVFTQVLRTFYGRFRYHRATFADFQHVAERVSRQNLSAFFDAWVDGKGMPTVRYTESQVITSKANGDARATLHLVLEQSNAKGRAPSPMEVPVFIRLVDGNVEQRRVSLHGRTATLDETFRAPIARIDVDPRFEVFRHLLDQEIPPTLSRALGASKMTFILPSFASQTEVGAWRAFAEKLCRNEAGVKECAIIVDDKIKELPSTGAVWVLGYANRLRGAAQGVRRYGAAIDDTTFSSGGKTIENAKHAVVLALEQPSGRPDDALVFVASHAVTAIEGLARKVPHYGKYSALAFTGEEPTNVFKATWPSVGSPMSIVVDAAAVDVGPIPPSPPLAKFPPPFSEAPLVSIVDALAAPTFEGRGLGSPGLKRATQFVAQRMQEIGLSPGANANTQFTQTFSAVGPTKKTIDVDTLVGRLEGRNPTLPPVVLTAHLDHLGRGEFGAKTGNVGKVHPGANDNASGVAVLLAVAQSMKNVGGFLRPIEFVVFTGEEAGLLDSTAYVAAQRARGPQGNIMAAINLDAVGRQRVDGFTVFGGKSATEWVHIFMGIGFTTGIGATLGAEGMFASDHKPFLDAGIPAVHIFGDAALEIHTPDDTAEKIDPQALVNAAILTREAIAYLANREAPLTSPGAPPKSVDDSAPAGPRATTLGTVPDYRFAGPGVRIHAVTSDSPASAAGLVAGDIIVAWNGRSLRTLRQMTYSLARAAPGEKVSLRIRRQEREFDVDVVLVAR